MGFKRTIAAILAVGFLAGSAQAEELSITNLVGKVPSSDEILEALITPTGIRIERPRPASVLNPAEPELVAVADAAEPPFMAVALDVQFSFDSANLTTNARQVLDALGEALTTEKTADFSFRIEGHTDAAGSEIYNLALSERRASAVKHYLSANYGVPFSRLQTVGKGETELYDPADPEGGANRRVQIVNLGSQKVAQLN